MPFSTVSRKGILMVNGSCLSAMEKSEHKYFCLAEFLSFLEMERIEERSLQE
jgi:hypothetical protein